jgi:cytochrome c-type biogenesis protein CcmH
MTAAFWVLAALFALVAAAFLFVPLWRERSRSGRWSPAALAAVALTIPAAVGLYLHVTTYTAPPAGHGGSAEERKLVDALADKMRANPDDVEGWRLLGRSYMALGEYANGRRAFTQAYKRTPMPDAGLKLSLAESMVLTDRSTLSGEAGDLIEDVLAGEPNNQTALWYGGWAALAEGRDAIARARWSRLLASNPPANISQILRQQLAQLGGAAGGAPGSEAGQGAAAGPRIELTVRVADEVPLAQMGPEARLFIFARAPGGGPPVAVLREPLGKLPGQFVLTDENSMIPGRSLGDFPELTLVARVSASGQPLEQSGDYFARATYKLGGAGPVELTIAEKVP